MAITIIVEDGSMPSGANSYVSLGEFAEYAEERGQGAEWNKFDESSRQSALIRAADTLNTYNWKGSPAESGRVMTWPRKGMVYADGATVPESFIPTQMKLAQCELAMNVLFNSVDPLAPVDTASGAVTSERVDVISVSYGDPSTNNYSGQTGYPAVDAWLKPFLKGGSGRFSLGEIGRG